MILFLFRFNNGQTVRDSRGIHVTKMGMMILLMEWRLLVDFSAATDPQNLVILQAISRNFEKHGSAIPSIL